MAGPRKRKVKRKVGRTEVPYNLLLICYSIIGLFYIPKLRCLNSHGGTNEWISQLPYSSSSAGVINLKYENLLVKLIGTT